MGLLSLIEHHFEGIEEFLFINSTIKVLIDGPDGLETLLLVNGRIHAKLFEEIIEEVSEFVFVEGAGSVGIVLVEDLLDVVPKHFILQAI